MKFSTRRATPWAAAFFGFWAGLTFVATHWPRLKLVAPIERPDLIAHLVAFGTWTIAATLCGFFGPRYSARNIAWSAGAAAIYASIDEALQFPAFLGRTVAWDDWASNQLGVALGATVCGAIGLVRWSRLVRRADSSAGRGAADVQGEPWPPPETR